MANKHNIIKNGKCVKKLSDMTTLTNKMVRLSRKLSVVFW